MGVRSGVPARLGAVSPTSRSRMSRDSGCMSRAEAAKFVRLNLLCAVLNGGSAPDALLIDVAKLR